MFWLDSVKWSLSSLICEQTNDGGCYMDDYPRYRQAQKYIGIYLYAYRQAHKYIIIYLYAYRQAHSYIIIYRHTNSRYRIKSSWFRVRITTHFHYVALMLLWNSTKFLITSCHIWSVAIVDMKGVCSNFLTEMCYTMWRFLI